jgi:hypothetical protein
LAAGAKEVDKASEALGFAPDILSPDFMTLKHKAYADWHAKSVNIPWVVNE